MRFSIKGRTLTTRQVGLLFAGVTLALIAGQSTFFYQHARLSADRNATLRAEIVKLRREVATAAVDGRRAVQLETDRQLTKFLAHAENRLATTTIDVIRVRKLVVLDTNDAERIILGMGRSELSGDPNTSIKLLSPSATHPIILSSTDTVASVSVDKRLAISADDKGRAGVHIYRAAYIKGALPMLVLGSDVHANAAGLIVKNAKGVAQVDLTSTPQYSRLMLFDHGGRPAVVSATSPTGSFHAILAGENRFRAALGLTRSSVAFSELYNDSGELVYAVQSSTEPWAKSYVKSDPASRAWNVASTFSTLKTFWDIFK